MEPMISYAQNFEDVVLRRALRDVVNGFYVDVGAWDPDLHSVTRHFYEKGWRGVNVEPIQTYKPKFEQSRPEDINLFVAVGKENGRATITQIDGTGLSTLALSPAVRELSDEAHGRQDVDVEMRRLDSIFEEHAPPQVHFLKIDCEGSESDVVNNFDLSRYRPWIILVEAIAPLTNEPNHTAWEQHILSANYEFVYFDGVNRFYVASEHLELKGAFSVPPNIFDNFKSLMFAPDDVLPADAPKSWFKRLFSD